MKHGANASLQGSTVSSRQPDKGIIFSCFVHSHKQSRKNMNDSNTWEAMRNEPWTNNIGRKQIICLGKDQRDKRGDCGAALAFNR